MTGMGVSNSTSSVRDDDPKQRRSNPVLEQSSTSRGLEKKGRTSGNKGSRSSTNAKNSRMFENPNSAGFNGISWLFRDLEEHSEFEASKNSRIPKNSRIFQNSKFATNSFSVRKTEVSGRDPICTTPQGDLHGSERPRQSGLATKDRFFQFIEGRVQITLGSSKYARRLQNKSQRLFRHYQTFWRSLSCQRGTNLVLHQIPDEPRDHESQFARIEASKDRRRRTIDTSDVIDERFGFSQPSQESTSETEIFRESESCDPDLPGLGECSSPENVRQRLGTNGSDFLDRLDGSAEDRRRSPDYMVQNQFRSRDPPRNSEFQQNNGRFNKFSEPLSRRTFSENSTEVSREKSRQTEILDYGEFFQTAITEPRTRSDEPFSSSRTLESDGEGWTEPNGNLEFRGSQDRRNDQTLPRRANNDQLGGCSELEKDEIQNGPIGGGGR